MNKKEVRSVLKDLAEQKAPAAQIDLWPAIQTRIQMSRSKPSRGTIMNTNSFLKPAVILAAILIIGALFLILPQGRALAQEIRHFFIRGESNVMPGVTITPVRWVEQTSGASAATLTPQPPQPAPAGPVFETTCGSFQSPHCTVDAIRKLVSFPVFAFASLPEGMHFSGATGGPDQVHLFYDTPNQTAFLILIEKPFTGTGNPLSMEVGADADIQSVPVGAAQAEYVKGSYNGNSSPPVWDSNLDLQQLRWVNQGVLFTLYMNGTQPRLSRDELAALAAALTDGPVSESAAALAPTATPAPTDASFDPRTAYPLTLEQVKEKAGFAPLAPALLPERLAFTGARYDEKTKMVEMYFKYNHPNNTEATDAVIIREMLTLVSVTLVSVTPVSVTPGGKTAPGADCDLCGFIQGDGKQVEQYPIGKLVSKDATIETVEIQGFTGQYLEGIGWVGSDCCGWQWDSEPYIKRLRFQANWLAVDITAYTYELTRADVLTIAGSLK